MGVSSWTEVIVAWAQNDPTILFAAILAGTIGGYLVLTSLGYFSFVHIQSKEAVISVSALKSAANKPFRLMRSMSFLLAIIEPPVLVAALVVFMASLGANF